jgi:hypothetical protein
VGVLESPEEGSVMAVGQSNYTCTTSLYPKQASKHAGFSSVSLSPQASKQAAHRDPAGWKHAYFRSVYEILWAEATGRQEDLCVVVVDLVL